MKYLSCFPWSRDLSRSIAATLIFLLIVVAIGKNYLFALRYWQAAVLSNKSSLADDLLATRFAYLAPILKGVAVAGYYSDQYGPDFWYTSPALVEYQRAQSVLATTILDAENPLSHDWVIIVCSRKGCDNGLVRENKLRSVITIDGKVSLVRRGGAVAR